jgi:hypothetical protein
MYGDYAADDDKCPHCRIGLDILCVKFRLAGARLLAACPNCAQTQDERRAEPHRPSQLSATVGPGEAMRQFVRP